MDTAAVRALGYILASNARVEGMRAANMQRSACGESMMYSEEDFFAEAFSMENTAGNLQG